MTWTELHKESERFSIEAHRALSVGDKDRAYDLFREAAQVESRALDQLDASKARTRGVTAVSAVALWFKAARYDQAEQLAYSMLADPSIPEFARTDLLDLVQAIWTETAKRNAGAAFLADQGFRDAIDFGDHQMRVSRTRRRLTEILTPATIAVLADALGAEADLYGRNPQERADRLAERLLDTDIRYAISALRTAHRVQLAESGPELAAPLVDVACLVIPALFGQGVVEYVRAASSRYALVPLNVGTQTVAELIMAGVDGRAALFRPRAYEHDQPAGQLSLPLAVEQGFAADPSAALSSAALSAYLGRKLDPGRDALQRLRAAIDDYLLDTFARTEPGAPRRERSHMIKLVADLLACWRQDAGQTLYMAFYLPEDPGERNYIEALVQELKRDYSAIAFLGLDPSVDRERAERALVEPLCRMLPLKSPSFPSDRL